jgi:neutral amino acid transport system ATP-binding protein
VGIRKSSPLHFPNFYHFLLRRTTNDATASSFEIAKRGLIRTFQLSKALTKLTVVENMMLAPQFQHGERIWNVWLRHKEIKRQEEDNRAKAISLLEFFGLLPLKDEYAGALSGGQKKLLEMARALMAEPKMLLLDEPFSGVNPTLAKKLVGHIRDLRDNKGMSFLIIEHDMPLIMQLSDYIYVLSRGKVIASGAPDEVWTNERVLDAYLGGALKKIKISGQLGGIYEVSFRYNVILGGYTTLMSDIPELCENALM